MAYQNKPRGVSDKDKERSPEEQTSINRQRARRQLNELKKQIKEDWDLRNMLKKYDKTLKPNDK